jgi:MFS family permease
MGGSPLQIAAWFTPLALGGIIISTVGGFVLPQLPGTLLFIFSCTCWVISPLLFALAPTGANYWAWTFPAMICGTLALDIMFTVTNVFIANSLPLRFQGLAGALINTLVMIGVAIFLGLADVLASEMDKKGKGKKEVYQDVFWFEVACAATALTITVFRVRIRKAESGLTRDEEEAKAREGHEESARKVASA